ncbi:MAG: DNA alkylation repair protein [Bryobacteraceae bacterium]
MPAKKHPRRPQPAAAAAAPITLRGATATERSAQSIAELQAQANPANVAGMARYGIATDRALGVPIPILRAMARRAGKDHALAAALWASGIHEARILATMVADPARLTAAQMDRWTRDFDSWDVCDQACQNLFRCTPHACAKAVQWSSATREFVRRAGFALMAGLAAQRNPIGDTQFEDFLKLIEGAATDDRNMVKKAVNWALRQIGKRNGRLLKKAIAAAERINCLDSRAARWIAKDALRELRARTLTSSR